MRDKLIELLVQAEKIAYELCITRPCSDECLVNGFCTDTVPDKADHLIANGVTVQQWIPVSERLPEKNCKCLVCVDVDVWGKEYKAIAVEHYNEDWLGWYSDGGKIPNVTHWMPMPELPKEGK